MQHLGFNHVFFLGLGSDDCGWKKLSFCAVGSKLTGRERARHSPGHGGVFEGETTGATAVTASTCLETWAGKRGSILYRVQPAYSRLD